MVGSSFLPFLIFPNVIVDARKSSGSQRRRDEATGSRAVAILTRSETSLRRRMLEKVKHTFSRSGIICKTVKRAAVARKSRALHISKEPKVLLLKLNRYDQKIYSTCQNSNHHHLDGLYLPLF